MKTGIRLERGERVRHFLSRRLKTKRSDVLTLKNLSGRAAATFFSFFAVRCLFAAPPLSAKTRRPCAMFNVDAVSLSGETHNASNNQPTRQGAVEENLTNGICACDCRPLTPEQPSTSRTCERAHLQILFLVQLLCRLGLPVLALRRRQKSLKSIWQPSVRSCRLSAIQPFFLCESAPDSLLFRFLTCVSDPVLCSRSQPSFLAAVPRPCTHKAPSSEVKLVRGK